MNNNLSPIYIGNRSAELLGYQYSFVFYYNNNLFAVTQIGYGGQYNQSRIVIKRSSDNGTTWEAVDTDHSPYVHASSTQQTQPLDVDVPQWEYRTFSACQSGSDRRGQYIYVAFVDLNQCLQVREFNLASSVWTTKVWYSTITTIQQGDINWFWDDGQPFFEIDYFPTNDCFVVWVRKIANTIFGIAESFDQWVLYHDPSQEKFQGAGPGTFGGDPDTSLGGTYMLIYAFSTEIHQTVDSGVVEDQFVAHTQIFTRYDSHGQVFGTGRMATTWDSNKNYINIYANIYVNTLLNTEVVITMSFTFSFLDISHYYASIDPASVLPPSTQILNILGAKIDADSVDATNTFKFSSIGRMYGDNGHLVLPFINYLGAGALHTDLTGAGSEAPTYRVNCGSVDFVGFDNNLWFKDYGNSGGSIQTTSTSVVNTDDPELYQSQRVASSGDLTYTIPVDMAGSYTVRLRFAELVKNAVGERKFNITINGDVKQLNLDVYNEAGGKFRALDKSWVIDVGSGVNIQTIDRSSETPTTTYNITIKISSGGILNAIELAYGTGYSQSFVGDIVGAGYTALGTAGPLPNMDNICDVVHVLGRAVSAHSASLQPPTILEVCRDLNGELIAVSNSQFRALYLHRFKQAKNVWTPRAVDQNFNIKYRQYTEQQILHSQSEEDFDAGKSSRFASIKPFGITPAVIITYGDGSDTGQVNTRTWLDPYFLGIPIVISQSSWQVKES